MPAALTNFDYTDRELLFLVADHADADGWVETKDIATIIGISAPPGVDSMKHAMRCVGSRFAYMVRQGWLERDESRTKWRVTDQGHELRNGKLNKSLTSALSKLRASDRVLLTRALTERYRDDQDSARTMIRREWQHGTYLNGRR